MTSLIRKYWLALVAAFAGTVAVTSTAFGVETASGYMEAHHTIEPGVRWVGETVGTFHKDPGAFFHVAEGGVTAASAKEMRQLKEKVGELGKNIDKILEKEDEIKNAKDAANNAKTKVEKISEKNAELVDSIKELQDSQGSIQDQLDEMDMKFQERPNGKPTKDVGREFAAKITEKVEQKNYDGDQPVAGDTFKAMMEDTGIKDITNVSSSAGDVVEPDFRDQLISSPVLRTPQILDLLTIMETSSDAVEWVKQTSETDSASPQSGQGSALSQSDFEFTLQTDPVETIGHIAKSSVQILNDAPRLRTWVNTRMRQLLELELEDQVLTGDGTGNNLEGLIPNATGYYSNLETQLVDGTTTDADRVAVMLAQLQRQNYPPTGIVLSPTNWWGIILQKDADENYQISGAQQMATPRLWGFPVVSSNAMPDGEALVGNFELAATFFDRRTTTLEIATENADDFEKLMVTMRAYLRGMQAIQRSQGLIHNDSMDTAAPSGS